MKLGKEQRGFLFLFLKMVLEDKKGIGNIWSQRAGGTERSSTGLLLSLILLSSSVQFSSVTQSCLTLCDLMNCSMPGFPVHHQLPEFAQTHPSSQWYQSTISSSVVPFSSHFQSFPASGCFPMSQCFASGGQIIGVSASASVLPMYQISFGSHYWLEWVRTCSYNLPWTALDYGPSLCSTRVELNLTLTPLSNAPSLSSTSVLPRLFPPPLPVWLTGGTC